MKRYTHSAIILFAALAIAGCTETEEFQGNPDSALQIESVSGISPFALMQDSSTRAVITSKNLPADEAVKGIGLFVTASNGGAYDGKTSGYSNVNYTYSTSKWNTASPVYLSNTTGKLYGYFPYNADATNLTSISVASSLNGTDYLYATPQEVSFSNKSVNLEMNHALARLHLTIKKGDKYPSDCNLSKIELQSKAIDATGTMDITTGTVTAAKGAAETGTVTMTGSDVSGAITSAGITKDILLVPADNSEGKKELTLILTIDGAEAKVNFTGGSGLDIRSGIQCNATIEIQDTGIKVTGVGVGTWGDGGSQTVEVSGHTVTVKIADGIDPNDILTKTYVDGNNVIIKANSFQGKYLVCKVGDNAQCKRTITNDKFTFTISKISSNIDAVLDYAPTVTLTVTSDSHGKVWIGDDKSKTSGQFESGRQVVIHADPNDEFRWFRWNDNNRETSRTITIGENDAEYSANFISSDLIPGLFTVRSSGKKVFFSKGNLYCSGVTFNDDGTVKSIANAKWGFEANQYDINPTVINPRDNNHISHFMWCSTPEKAMASISKYDSHWNGETPFFAANGFTVNGFNEWRVLSGGDNGEWAWILNKRTMEKSVPRYTNKVGGITIGGSSYKGLFIYPDDYSGKEVGDGTETWTWDKINSAGIVFLPAAGYLHYDNIDPSFSRIVFNIGNTGHYWSSTTEDENNSFGLEFMPSYVTCILIERNNASSVRLVTDEK